MTDYVFEGQYSWREDNTPLYTLGTLDRLTISNNAFLNSLGSNSPIARIQGPAAIQLMSSASVWAEDVAFHSTSGGVTFDLHEASVIYTGGIGILIEADPGSEARNTINVASSAAIVSRNSSAVLSSGHTTINNQGTIHTSPVNASALVFTGGHNDISNSGYIQGGILIYGGDNRIYNEFQVSDAQGPAINLVSFDAGESNLIINKGVIYSGSGRTGPYDVAIVANGPANVTLENEWTGNETGYIFGDVYFGAGNDVIKNFKNGLIEGYADLGAGNDRLENYGFMVGDINLGEGADSVTNYNVITSMLHGGTGNDSVTNYAFMDESVFLGAGDDEFFNYGSGSVRVKIDGGDGSDKLHGGSKNDRLNGGDGNDFLHGGAGRDTFIFDAPISGKNIDKIDDFNGLEDRIQLARSVFSQLNLGTLDQDAFRDGAAPADASDRIGYNYATGAVWYDPDGTGAAKAVTFLWLRPGLSYISADDFFVV